MPPMNWRRPISPEWQIPPAETVEAAAQREAIDDIDRQLLAIALMRTRSPGRADALLDKRNTIRAPSVPVAPGPDFDDYWGNSR